MKLKRYLMALAVASVTLLMVGEAMAQYKTRGFRPAAPKRSFGVGTAFGGGYAAVSVVSSTGSTESGGNLALLLPTLELQFFTRRGHSIDISVPISNLLIVSAVTEGFFFMSDVFYNFNMGNGQAQLLLGPGLGLSMGSVSGAFAMSFRVPATIGVEFLTRARGFGFKIMLRPYVEFAVGEGSGSTASAVGGGALLDLGLSWYGTR